MKVLLLLFLALLYAALIVPYSHHLDKRIVVEKLALPPRSEVIRVGAGDQRLLAAQALIFKAVIYYGTLAEINDQKMILPPDFYAIYRAIGTAVKLDPYNMDGYYFGQAVLAWDANQAEAANLLLENGMRYRTWDYYLPFFAGFNYWYFLNDYSRAADNFRKAAALSGNPLFGSLASRFYYQSGNTTAAIEYLTMLERSERNDGVRKNYRIRLQALRGIQAIEQALESYRRRHHRLPGKVADLVDDGALPEIPQDPYGGVFFIDDKGHVKTTSNLTAQSAPQALPPLTRH